MTSHIGAQLGNYRLVQLLGQGGFAEVYLGEHIHIRKQAAIKVLHAHLTETASADFQREAQIIADLRHPHIVNILDFAIQGDLPFLIMDYYANGSLRRRHPRGSRVPLPLVVSYTEQLAEALSYAHEKHIIHRDVKPENMLIGGHDEIILSDFGIAAIAQSSSSTSREAFAGTSYYMAPEQIRYHSLPASDQYALAVVVYEWLTGRVPFQGTLMEIFSKHLMAEPPSPREHVPDLLPDIEQVLLIALSKDPERRFATVSAFAKALAVAAQPALSFSQPPKPTLEFSQSPYQSAGEARATVPFAYPASESQHALGEPWPGEGSEIKERESRKSGQLITPILTNSLPLEKQASRQRRRPLTLIGLFLAFILVIGGSLAFFALTGKHAPGTAIPDRQGLATATADASLYATATSESAHLYPAYLPGKGQLAFYDPMSSPGNWEQDINQQHTGLCKFTGGAYHTTMDENGYRWCIDDNGDNVNFANFAYQMQVTILKGDCAGILFRFNDQATYIFLICQWGEQRLSKFTSTVHQYILLEGNAHTAAIHTGLNQSNLLSIVAQGPEITVFVNGQQVGQVQDSTDAHGIFGTIAIDEKSATDAIFRDATMWTL